MLESSFEQKLKSFWFVLLFQKLKKKVNREWVIIIGFVRNRFFFSRRKIKRRKVNEKSDALSNMICFLRQIYLHSSRSIRRFSNVRKNEKEESKKIRLFEIPLICILTRNICLCSRRKNEKKISKFEKVKRFLLPNNRKIDKLLFIQIFILLRLFHSGLGSDIFSSV